MGLLADGKVGFIGCFVDGIVGLANFVEIAVFDLSRPSFFAL